LAYRRDYEGISSIEFINKGNTGNSGVSGFRNKAYLGFSSVIRRAKWVILQLLRDPVEPRQFHERNIMAPPVPEGAP